MVREEASRAQETDAGAVVRMAPPWTWSVVALVALLVIAAIGFAWLAHIEMTDRARGITRPAGGVRPLFAQSDAVVAEVFVQSGQRVAANTPIARLRSADTEATLVEVEREIARASRDRDSILGDTQFERQRAELLARIDSMEQQRATLRDSASHRQRRLEAMLELERSGLVSAIQAGDEREEALQSMRAQQAAGEALARTRQELAALDAARARDLRAAERALQEATARRDALALPLQRGLIAAPDAGVVEALLPRPGDYVRAGQVIARLVSEDAAPRIVAFVPEKHRASVRAGDRAAVELDQFPSLEFGALPARVVRVAGDLASRQEVAEAMGDGVAIEGARVRVELELLPSPHLDRVRAGMLLDVRLTLRRQRLLAALLEPLAPRSGT